MKIKIRGAAEIRSLYSIKPQVYLLYVHLFTKDIRFRGNFYKQDSGAKMIS